MSCFVSSSIYYLLKILFLCPLYTQHGVQTHSPEIKVPRPGWQAPQGHVSHLFLGSPFSAPNWDIESMTEELKLPANLERFLCIPILERPSPLNSNLNKTAVK